MQEKERPNFEMSGKSHAFVRMTINSNWVAKNHKSL
jgi:hypothetical protein